MSAIDPADSKSEPGSGVVMDPVGAIVRVPAQIPELESFITPTEQVFVVAHLGIARLTLGAWQLKVEGAVETPLGLTYDELRKLPCRRLTAFIECAGNPLRPDVPVRRIGNVVWGGVPLSEVLARTGIRSHARYVCLEGADSGTYAGVYNERYTKDLPLTRALQGDVLLAYEMNDAPLSAEHGFPVRALIPGYYGTNSVKWLSRVYLAESRPQSLFTTELYNRRVSEGDRSYLEPVWEVGVESVIVWPARGDALMPGLHRVSGWAWGAQEVVRLEVSADGGLSWEAAQLEPRQEAAWQQFTFGWNASTKGQHVLASRATDARGQVQPSGSGRNRIYQVAVTVA